MAKLIHVEYEDWDSSDHTTFLDWVTDNVPEGKYIEWDSNEVLVFEQDFTKYIKPYLANSFKLSIFKNDGTLTNLTKDIT
jgi:hypothetical protein